MEAPDREPRDELSSHIPSRLCSIVQMKGIGCRARVICFSGRCLQTFKEMVFQLLGPSHSHVDNVLQVLKSSGKSLELTLGQGPFICSLPKVVTSNGLQSHGQRLGHWSSAHLEK